MKCFYTCVFFILISISGLCQQLEGVQTFNGLSGNSFFGLLESNFVQDDDGNYYIYSDFIEEVDFDPGVEEYILVSGIEFSWDPMSGQAYLLKLNQGGEFQWVKTLETNYFSGINGVLVNEIGEIILTGTYSGEVDLNPGIEEEISSNVESDEIDMFVIKLSAMGDYLWSKTIETNIPFAEQNHIVLDEDENIYLTGRISQTVDVDPGDGEYLLEPYNGSSPFIMRLNPDGEFEWAKSYGSTGFIRNKTLNIIDGDGLILTGRFDETAELSGSENAYEVTAMDEGTDIYISKFDLDGNFLWANIITGMYSEEVNDVDVDSQNNIVLAGIFTSEIEIGNPGGETIFHHIIEDENTPVIDKGTFVSKLDSDGNFVWCVPFDLQIYDSFDASDHKFKSLVTDAFGNIYIGGQYRRDVDLVPGYGQLIFSSADTFSGSYMLKIDSSGEFIWAHDFNGEYSTDIFDMNISSEGILSVMGRHQQSTDFDPNPDSETTDWQDSDSFLAHYSQGPCDNFTLYFDSLSHVNCSEEGYANGIASNGVEPYSYSWNTIPEIEMSSIQTETPGIYELTAVDIDGCSRTVIALLEGPASLIQQDLKINMLSSEFRTGFPAYVLVDALNDGCEAVSGTISMVKDPLIDFESATIPPNEILGDSLVWNFENYVYESGHFQSLVNFTTSLEAQIGDTICLDLYIYPVEGDAKPGNNHRHYCYPVVNGYDPNDKQVYPQGACEEHYTLKDEVLTYTVRFQNTGNSEAINIHVIDSLSPFLDINSLSVVAKSHEMFTEILPGNVLNFKFDNILLPDSASEELLSQGYVIFEISPFAELPNGTLIENTSQIYFDFNPAVVTNTTFNTLVDEIPSCSTVDGLGEGKSRISLSVYPNPTASSIELRCEYEVDQISVFDFAGRLVLESQVRGTQIQIELSSLNSGIYFIHVQTVEGMVVKKVVVN